MRTIFAKIINRLGYFCAIGIIVVAMCSSLLQMSAPFLMDHRKDLEKWASELLHLPVTIGEIQAAWHGYWPEISFYHVTLFDVKAQKPKLKIQKIDVNINLFKSLLHWQPVAADIELSGAHLVVQHSAEGNLQIAGFPEWTVSDSMAGDEMQSGVVLGWIFSQQALSLKNIDIDYIAAKKEPHYFHLKELSLSNTSTDHHLQLQIILKQNTPTKLQADFNWQGNIMDWKTVSAEAYLKIKELSLGEWLAEESWHGLQVKDGLGSAKVWMNWSAGELKKVTTQLQFYNTEFHSTLTNKDAAISRVMGRFNWEHVDNKQVLSGEEIFFDFPDHLWPESQFYYVIPDGKTPSSLQLGYLDFADASRFLQMTDILPDNIKKILITAEPRGQLENFNAAWLENFSDIEHTSISANLIDVGLHAMDAIPEVAHLSGDFSWTGKQGSAHLQSKNLEVNFKRVFASPLFFNEASAVMDFQKETDGSWILHANHIIAKNEDLNAEAKMSLRFPLNDSPAIDLAGDFMLHKAEHVSTYLPLQIFKPTLQQWLRKAFLSGKVSAGKAILQGRLKDFPFEKGEGKFLIQGEVKDVNFAYAPGWPIISKINGNLNFSGRKMTADIAAGQLQSIPLHNIHGVIPSLGGAEKERIEVSANIQTDFSEGLRFIRESPLQKTLGRHFSNLEIQGLTQLKLFLSIPLETPDTAKVSGDVTITEGRLEIPAWKIILSPLNGLFHFTENTVEANKLKTKIFGEPAILDITTQLAGGIPDYVSVKLNNRMTMETLEKLFSFNSSFIEGATDVETEIRLFPHKENQIFFRSTLQGITIALPAPFGKKSAEKRLVQADVAVVNEQLSTINIHYDENTRLRVNNNKNTWNIGVDNPNFAGQIIWPVMEHKLMAKFQRLYIHALNDKTSTDFNSSVLPEINFEGNDVRYEDKFLGHVIFNSVPDEEGVRLKLLTMNSELFQLRATGYWRGRHSALQGSISTTQLSDLLNQWGLHSENFVCSNANMNFNLSWPGMVFDPSLPNLMGHFSIKLGEGRILNVGDSDSVQMGIGKMLNIFNLSTIPRRLSLDFSDVFEKGYSFDVVKGDFELKNGDAYTANTYFEGPLARIDIAGRFGLVRKDYNLNLSVTPHVTSSLWVVSAYAAGPLAGAAAFLADKVIGTAVSTVTTHNYVVTGPWDNPLWKKTNSQ